MTAAIVHYHLRPGGVTRVIDLGQAALGRAGVGVVILAGEAAGGDVRLPVRVVDGLQYGFSGGGTAAELAVRARSAAAEIGAGREPDVWHFHNPFLGKNRLMAPLVETLARQGEPLILHLHDFAEDGRPRNHQLLERHGWSYPTGPRIHYVFLNESDRGIFTRAGLPPEQSSVVENPLSSHSPAPPLRVSGGPLVFYPVRGIRRKNLGEILLWSALAAEGARFAISRAPDNPEWAGMHRSWRQLAEKLKLPVDFEVVGRLQPPGGGDGSFESWVGACSHFITTSVAEGFGMTFSEAAAAGRPLLGRNLPKVTGAIAASLDAGHLYERVLVPAEWLDAAYLRRWFSGWLPAMWRQYGRDCPAATLEAGWAEDYGGSVVDFGKLPETFQAGVLRRLRDAGARAELRVEIGGGAGSCRRAQDWLDAALEVRHRGSEDASMLARHAADRVAAVWQGLYHQVAGAPGGGLGFLDKRLVLNGFLARDRIHPLAGCESGTRF
jgi:glycosyltransferase involved in cell wall biosynthesis